jgi:lipopolysaccharide/colanic/teichoic acid biosynthesis glycosyltransferase
MNIQGQSTQRDFIRRRRFRIISLLWLLLGIGVCTGGVYAILTFGPYKQGPIFTLWITLFVGLFYIFASVTLRKIRHLPSPNLIGILVFLVAVLYGIAFLTLEFAGFSGYWLPLLIGIGGSSFFIGIWALIARKVVYQNLLTIPCRLTKELLDDAEKAVGVTFTPISEPLPLEDVLGEYDGVVIDSKEPLPPQWYDYVLKLRFARVPLYEASDMYEMVTGRVSLAHVSEGYAGDLLQQRPAYSFIKRIIDLLGVLFTLPITLPIMLITMLLIRIESPGKVIFTQQRIGFNNKEFTIYKFRSMRTDAEKFGPQFAQQGDARVTRIGAVIRKFRIDELPQIWNIITGEMSWIGPRPEQPKFVIEFENTIPYYASRHLTRPGITGWAQVTQGYAADIAETSVKLSYDLFYIKNFGFWLDLMIVFKTLRAIATGFGAR